MGVTLSRAARWTSVEGSKGKLEYTSINEYILNEITQFAVEFPGKNPLEGGYVFKKPLEWTTDSITLSQFSGQYNTNADGSVESAEKAPNGVPLLVARKKDNKSITICVQNFQQCAAVLNIAKEKRLAEARSCLESTYLNFLSGSLS